MIDAQTNDECHTLVEMSRSLDLGWACIGNEPLLFFVSHSGLSASGSSKGYYYSSDPSLVQGKLVTQKETREVEGQAVFKHIENGWYLISESW